MISIFLFRFLKTSFHFIQVTYFTRFIWNSWENISCMSTYVLCIRYLLKFDFSDLRFILLTNIRFYYVSFLLLHSIDIYPLKIFSSSSFIYFWFPCIFNSFLKERKKNILTILEFLFILFSAYTYTLWFVKIRFFSGFRRCFSMAK